MSFLCWGPQSWMRHSRWGLTRAQQPVPAAHTAFDAAQDTTGFLGCECTQLGHVQSLIQQYSQSPSWQGCSQTVHPPAYIDARAALTHVQNFALGHIKPREIPMGTLLIFVQVPLNGIPYSVNWITQLGVTRKFAEGALIPFVINEDIK
ncbi:hypothetical protein BTVI_70404 [Pitangus sulphuratus]|nr:hypothetical protein BTVI_70404 [Pitangus sulphuratus]